VRNLIGSPAAVGGAMFANFPHILSRKVATSPSIYPNFENLQTQNGILGRELEPNLRKSLPIFRMELRDGTFRDFAAGFGDDGFKLIHLRLDQDQLQLSSGTTLEKTSSLTRPL